MTFARKLARNAKSILGRLRSGGARSQKEKSWSHERSPELVHSRVQPAATFSPWLSDAEFLAAHERIRRNTLVDQYRCYELWQLARQSASVEGAILEVGVWRGGTGCLLALAAPRKTVYLCDTFAGVVNAGEQDTRYLGGEHADTSEEVARKLLASAGVTNAQILTGIFPAETAASVEGAIALLHVDVDVYQSAKDTVEWALPRLQPGAAIIFDDYGFFGCEGVTRYVHELRDLLQEFVFLHNLNGHAVFVKTSKNASA
jgi:O-methyltransferase